MPANVRTFSEVSAISQVAPGRFTANLDPEWTIAGKPHGGYLLAILGRSAAVVGPHPHPHPLAASAHYLRSPSPGPVEVDIEVLRAGRSASQVRARLVQDDAVCIEALMTTGTVHRGSDVTWSGIPFPDIAARAECLRLPGVTPQGVSAAIMAQVDLRLDPATTGFTRDRPSGRGELRGWLSLPADEAFDVLSLLYAVDAFPPASFEVAPSGWVPTLEMTVYVRALPAPGPVRVSQRAQLIADERLDEVCLVWDGTGRLVAQATQLAGIRLL